MSGRLARSDFIEEDGVRGYADNGVDDFEQAEQFTQSDEDDRPTKGEYTLLSPLSRSINLSF